jgi:E3 ubiquitin-protein ligase BRE1
MTAHVSGDPPLGFVSALEDNMNATQTLLTKFMRLGGQNSLQLLHDEAYLSCQRAQTEVRYCLAISHLRYLTGIGQCIALRSQVDVMRVKLRDSVAENETLHTALVAAQTQADRLQSSTVLAMQARAAVHEQKPKEEEIEEPQQKLPSPPEVSGLVNWWEFTF